MEIDYRNMRTDELESIYLEADRHLQTLLLNGAPWDEVQEQMVIVTQLSIAMHKNKYPANGQPYVSSNSNSNHQSQQQQ